MKMTPKPRNS